MKKLTSILLVASLLTPFSWANDQIAQEASLYRNMRESHTILISENKGNEISQQYAGTKKFEKIRTIVNDRNINRCASLTVSALKKTEQDVKEAILALRLNNDLDDVSAGLLLKASELNKRPKLTLVRNDLMAEDEERALELLKKEVATIYSKGVCPEDAYRKLAFAFFADSVKFKKNFKFILEKGNEQRILNDKLYADLEFFRANKVHEWPITLNDYASTIEKINKTFPNRKEDSSAMVTNIGTWKNKTSLRSQLHEKFNGTQIILLGNVIKDLKRRLESKDINVHIEFSDGPTEIISFSPMEKFRFILKLLRKELATLNNGSLLGGRQATYRDLIVAAYELGYVSSVEIEQLASLEEIWNPQKTTKEKVMFWVKMFGGVASAFLPPPFGFVSVLAIMVIDQQLAEAPVDRDSDFNLL